MRSTEKTQPDAILDRLVLRIQQLRHLDLSDSTERAQALTASRQILGTLALYRGLLAEERAGQSAAAPEPVHVLQAA